MPAIQSNMLPLRTMAPDFHLPSVSGNTVSLADFADSPALLVAFVCNHCPFVVHVKDELQRIWEDYSPRGLAFVGINPNDSDEYPEDSFENMRLRAEEWAWRFPYLHDESQAVAAAYRAACTPDFFLFNAGRELVYRGQLDSSRPNSGVSPTGVDLRRALDAVLEGETPSPDDQKLSIGCSIKWKPGRAPGYAQS